MYYTKLATRVPTTRSSLLSRKSMHSFLDIKRLSTTTVVPAGGGQRILYFDDEIILDLYSFRELINNVKHLWYIIIRVCFPTAIGDVAK